MECTPAAVTADAVRRLRALRSDVVERRYPGLGHDAVIGPSSCDVLVWLAAHGGRPVRGCHPAPSPAGVPLISLRGGHFAANSISIGTAMSHTTAPCSMAGSARRKPAIRAATQPPTTNAKNAPPTLREAVRFERVPHTPLDERDTAFVEISPHPVLTVGVQETIDAAGSGAVVLGTLRRDEGGIERFLTSLAEAHTHGVAVDWRPAFPHATVIDLPTYPFQRDRFWLEATREHPFLDGFVELAEGGDMLLTGRLSLDAQPWLADHAVLGTVLLPGTAFVELAVQAADRVGCDRVDELTLHAPLVVPEQGVVCLQLWIGEPAEDGHRSFRLHSRPDSDLAEGQPWTRNATGVLATHGEPAAAGHDEWPPADATAVDLDGLHDRLAQRGLDYGPAFRGLRAAWRREEEVFAEAALPEAAFEASHPDSFAVHPALLDAALQAIGLGDFLDEADGPLLPFSWSGVTVTATGTAVLRVRLSPAGQGAVAVSITDVTGRPVADVAALALRPFSAQRRGAPWQDALFHVAWNTQPAGASTVDIVSQGSIASWPDVLAAASRGSGVVLVDCRSVPGAGLAAEPKRGLGLLQAWLAEERFVDATLALLTHGALAVHTGEDVPDLGAAAVWGLVRSAQSEHPCRFMLVDIDECDASQTALHTALGSGEPQIGIRAGTTYLPRLAKVRDLLVPAVGTRLDVTTRGTLENLSFVPAPAAEELEPGQIRVAVRAAGLNFRDVLIALGVYPGAAVMGAEGAGVVIEVGPGVADLAPGDRVFGLIPAAFARRAVADHRLLARIPSASQRHTEPPGFAQRPAPPLPSRSRSVVITDRNTSSPEPAGCR